jgi:hypothetical protein
VDSTLQSCISARSTSGVHVRGLSIGVKNTGFTGDVIDFSHQLPASECPPGGPFNQGCMDASSALIETCRAFGMPIQANGSSPRSLVSFNKAIISTVRNCAFQGGATYAILGCDSPDSYSNAIQVLNCSFNYTQAAHIYGVGEAWMIHGNTFEPLGNPTTGVGGIQAPFSNAKGVSVVGNWFGDASKQDGTTTEPVAGEQITINGCGWHLSGNFIAGGLDPCIKILPDAHDIAIVGNSIDNPLNTGIIGPGITGLFCEANCIVSL